MVQVHPGPPRGISSAGRAPALHAGGQRFDPAILHQVTFSLYFRQKISSFENLARVCPGLYLGQVLWRTEVDLEQSVEDSTEKIEKKSNEKGTGRMPWLQEAMKDVASCDKPRGEANIL